MPIYQNIEETRPGPSKLTDKRNVWESVARIPLGLLRLIDEKPDDNVWEFTTYKGSHVMAIKVAGTEAIDFWAEMPS